MAKKQTKKSKSKSKSKRDTVSKDDAITEDKLLGYFTVAYVLDVAGLLDPRKKAKLDSLVFPGAPTWDETVEATYGINRTFTRSVYALCTEVQTAPAAVLFILRGIGCPDYQTRLEEVLELPRNR